MHQTAAATKQQDHNADLADAMGSSKSRPGGHASGAVDRGSRVRPLGMVLLPEADRSGGVSPRDAVRDAVGDRAFLRFFEDDATALIEEGRLVIEVGTRFAAERIRGRFDEHLTAAARRLGGDSHEVRLGDARGVETSNDAGSASNGSSTDATNARTHERHATARSSDRPSSLTDAQARRTTNGMARSPRGSAGLGSLVGSGSRSRSGTSATVRTPKSKDLDSFVVGQSNRLAFAAAKRVAEDESASACCPLVVHGACGNGKTHLLRAIVERFRAVHPGARARYVTAEQFTNAFIAALKRNAVAEFQAQFRSLSLLCVDDIQFFGHKSATQAELLHTFDAIELSGARVVLASDEHPRALADLNDALVSRFVSGAVVEVGEPDPELREAIIRAGAVRRGLPIDEAAVRAIAHGIGLAGEGPSSGRPKSVRDLEGALTRVEAVFKLMPELRTPEGLVGALLASRAAAMSSSRDTAAEDTRPVPLDRLLRVVGETLGVEKSELHGKGRHKRVVLARSMIVLVARRISNASFPEIARALGRTNHSTVITAYQRVSRQVDQNESIAVGSRFDGTPYGELASQLEREARARRDR